MKWKTTNLHTRLNLIATTILAVGLGSALVVYLRAQTASDNNPLQEFENSKVYEHELELYGGTMNVLSVQFSSWFQGLWHGEKLAYTIACITLVISLGFFFVAHVESTRSQSDAQGKNNQTGPVT